MYLTVGVTSLLPCLQSIYHSRDHTPPRYRSTVPSRPPHLPAPQQLNCSYACITSSSLSPLRSSFLSRNPQLERRRKEIIEFVCINSKPLFPLLHTPFIVIIWDKNRFAWGHKSSFGTVKATHFPPCQGKAPLSVVRSGEDGTVGNCLILTPSRYSTSGREAERNSR